MKTHATVSAQTVFSQMIGLFQVMAGLRSVPKSHKENRHEVLPCVMKSVNHAARCTLKNFLVDSTSGELV